MYYFSPTPPSPYFLTASFLFSIFFSLEKFKFRRLNYSNALFDKRREVCVRKFAQKTESNGDGFFLALKKLNDMTAKVTGLTEQASALLNYFSRVFGCTAGATLEGRGMFDMFETYACEYGVCFTNWCSRRPTSLITILISTFCKTFVHNSKHANFFKVCS
jgi:hypothetical protein